MKDLKNEIKSLKMKDQQSTKISNKIKFMAKENMEKEKKKQQQRKQITLLQEDIVEKEEVIQQLEINNINLENKLNQILKDPPNVKRQKEEELVKMKFELENNPFLVK